MTGLNGILRRLLAIYAVLIALLICWQCADIYMDAYSPEMLSEHGTPLAPVYTPEKAAEAVKDVFMLSAGFPVLTVIALIAGRNEKKASGAAGLEPEYALMRLKKRAVTLPEAAADEEKRRKRIRSGCGIALSVCAAGSLSYLLNRNNFASWDLEPVMGRMLLHVLPWVVLGFAAMCIFSVLEGRSAEREAEILKSVPKTAENRVDAKRRGFPVNAVRWALLAAAIAFIALGVMNGDPRSVMAKAIRICTECIGLG